MRHHGTLTLSTKHKLCSVNMSQTYICREQSIIFVHAHPISNDPPTHNKCALANEDQLLTIKKNLNNMHYMYIISTGSMRLTTKNITLRILQWPIQFYYALIRIEVLIKIFQSGLKRISLMICNEWGNLKSR